MKKDEILEVMEYHFKKIKKLCQIYVEREIDYKTGINNSRLIEVCKLIELYYTNNSIFKNIYISLNDLFEKYNKMLKVLKVENDE